MISISGKITKRIENNFRKFSNLTQPQKRNLKELTKGLLLTKSCFLSEIGRRMSPEINDRKNIERYSRSLEKSDSFGLIEAHLKSKKKHLNNGKGLKNPNLILVDGGEILKPNCPKKFETESSQKMQYCCGIADGSEQHKPGWGYKMINISAYTPHNERTHILSQHLFSSNAPKYNSDWAEQKQQLELLEKVIDPQNSILIEDSIGDDQKRIKFYQNEMKTHFIVRSQNKRKYRVNFEGDRVKMSFKEIAENSNYDAQNIRTYLDKKVQKKVTSKITYFAVEHEDLVSETKAEANSKETLKGKGKGEENLSRLPLYLVLVKSEAYEAPMALLTNIEPTDSEMAWNIFFWYKKRWEVEKIYRDIKQKFKLESGLIRSYKAWQTLVVLTALAWELMQEFTRETKEFLGECFPFFEAWLHKKQQKVGTHLLLIDFLRQFLWDYRPIYSHRFFSWNLFLNRFNKPINQLSLFDWRQKMGNL